MSRPIKVFCDKNDKIFDNIKEAGKYYNIDPSSISKVLKGKQKTAGGFKWFEYVEKDIENSVLEKDISENNIENNVTKNNNLTYKDFNPFYIENIKTTKEEQIYWINKFIEESKTIHSMQELNQSIYDLYISIKYNL